MHFDFGLPESVRDAMIGAGLRNNPNECCGFLLGVLETPEDRRPVGVS